MANWDDDAYDIAAWIDTSFNQPRNANTVTSDIASQRQAVDTSGTGDVWGGWFRNLAGAAVSYTLQRDNLDRTRAAQAVPVAQIALPQNRPVNQGTILMIGAAVVAVLVLR